MTKYFLGLLAALSLTGCVGYVQTGPPVVGVSVGDPVVIVDPFPYYYCHPWYGWGYYGHPYSHWHYVQPHGFRPSGPPHGYHGPGGRR
jgi:hypothetical protein